MTTIRQHSVASASSIWVCEEQNISRLHPVLLLPRIPSIKLFQTPQSGVRLSTLQSGSTPRSLGHCLDPNELPLCKCGCAQSIIEDKELPSAMNSTCYSLWLVTAQDCWGSSHLIRDSHTVSSKPYSSLCKSDLRLCLPCL